MNIQSTIDMENQTIRIAFSCPGDFDINLLPDWIKVHPHKYKNADGKEPAFASKNVVSISALLQTLIPKKVPMNLVEVAVREKYSSKHGTYWVLSFCFDAMTPRIPEVEKLGMSLLQRLLFDHWRKVRVYQYYERDGGRLRTSVSATTRMHFSESAVFSAPNEWGIREKVN